MAWRCKNRGVIGASTIGRYVCYSLLLLTLALSPCLCDVIKLGPEDDVKCISKGDEEGQVQSNKAACAVPTSAEYAEYVNAEYNLGLNPKGKCVACGGDWSSYLPCEPGVSGVTYAKGQYRYCACNIGFFGNQLFSGCRRCPVGTTTQGYAATKSSDCNICDVGYVGKAPNCVACSSKYKNPVTTAGPGNDLQCVCPRGFTGQPGKCQRCIGYDVMTDFPGGQQCYCAAGGTPPFCTPCAAGEIVDGKCVCPAGYTGKWPNCKSCPNSLSYDTKTYHAGTDQPCKCNLETEYEDIKATDFLERDSKGGCKCNEKRGAYLKVVPNYRWNSEWSLGPCDRICFDLHTCSFPGGQKIVEVNGKKRLGCDIGKKYGASLASQVFSEDRSGPFCLKCTEKNAYIEKSTTRCLCKEGYGVNPLYGKRDDTIYDTTYEPEPPFNSRDYCIKCPSKTGSGSKVILGTYPELQTDDVFCRCNWEENWGGGVESYGCAKCPDALMKVNMTTGECECPAGYWLDSEANKCKTNPSCGPGQEPDGKGGCICNLILTEDDQCVYPSKECKRAMLKFWKYVESANGQFPKSIVDTKPHRVKSRSMKDVFSSANLLNETNLASKKMVAVSVEGCFCSKDIATTVVELTTVGSGQLQVAEYDENDNLVFNRVISQRTPHSKPRVDHYGIDHWSIIWVGCVPFRVFFYSGEFEGLLQLRTKVTAYKPNGPI